MTTINHDYINQISPTSLKINDIKNGTEKLSTINKTISELFDKIIVKFARSGNRNPLTPDQFLILKSNLKLAVEAKEAFYEEKFGAIFSKIPKTFSPELRLARSRIKKCEEMAKIAMFNNPEISQAINNNK